jgi:hypothetical protein
MVFELINNALNQHYFEAATSSASQMRPASWG